MKKYKISIFDGERANQATTGRVVEVGLLELADVTSTKMWSPFIYRDNKRSANRFISTDLLVLDVDDGCPLVQAVQDFKKHLCIICPTKSHQKEKNGKVCDRFRIILPLGRTILRPEHYASTWKSAYEKWSYIDPACKDLARFYFPSNQGGQNEKN